MGLGIGLLGGLLGSTSIMKQTRTCLSYSCKARQAPTEIMGLIGLVHRRLVSDQATHAEGSGLQASALAWIRLNLKLRAEFVDGGREW